MTPRELDHTWVDPWADRSVAGGWSHTSAAVTRAGDIVVGASSEPTLLFLDRHGHVRRRAPTTGLVELHGFALVEEAGAELLWIADSGAKDAVVGANVDWTPSRQGGGVALVDLDGRTLRTLARPAHPAYEASIYQPTAVAVDEARLGGSGDVWVADGYGAGLVHRYDANGRHRATLTGAEGAGRFACPHGLLVDRRGADPELYVADRGNRRVQVFDLAGRFRRSFGEGVLAGPSSMATLGHLLVVTDLMAGRLSIFDADDALVGHLFANPDAPGRGAWPDAWPNTRGGDGTIVRPALVPGTFNSPHGVAVDDGGAIIVTEWVLGGRFAKLAPGAGPD